MPKPFFQNKEAKLQEIIRVDHAGEYGAQEIYEGQIKYTHAPEDKKLLLHMLEHEKEHLEYFATKIKNHEARPTILMPLWKLAGWSAGAISAKMGIKYAMLLTENVETVIEEHYQKQIEYLQIHDPKNPMLQKIKKFQQDEIKHKHIASENKNNNIITSNIIKLGCKIAIFLSKRI